MLRTLRRTLVIAGVLVFADAFVLNQGVIAVATALGALIGGVPRALLAWRRSEGAEGTAFVRSMAVSIFMPLNALVPVRCFGTKSPTCRLLEPSYALR